MNEEKNTVFAYEKVMAGDEELSKKPDYGKIIVKTKDSDDADAFIKIGSILDSVSAIAASGGFVFQKTDDEQNASYPPGYKPVVIENANINQNPKKYERFCTNCGTKMTGDSRFCPSCGADSRQEGTARPKPYVSSDPQPIYAQQYPPVQHTAQNKPKKKTPTIAIILISILIIGGLIVGGIFLGNRLKDKKTDLSQDQLDSTVSTTSDSTSRPNSSVVSSGVKASDLGNILNGQYYFATDQYIFYSSFDVNDKAHIYALKKDESQVKSIFDGFGWSLVVVDDWLYFSGNQGEAIDGTYHIFRMKFDGSQVEKINDQYSYGMFLYGDYLYYIQSSSGSEGTKSVCRSFINGENKEVLFTNGLSPLIYKDQLYYYDNQGNMYRTKPDGTDPQVLLVATVDTYIISGEKIIYKDFNDNIYACDLDGGNNQLIRSAAGTSIYNINAYNDRIFFFEYDTEFNYTAYGYNYTIKSCNMDGSDEKTVYSSVSYGIYMNLVNNKLMLMDYAMSDSSGVMSAVINVMDLDGGNLSELDR